MKSRKLFAILTLVAFMMTLLPMAAFAGDANRFASKVETDKTSVDADNSSFVKFTVYLFDDANGIATNSKVYVASSRATTDKFYQSDGTTALTLVADNVFETPVATDGKIEFKVKSAIAGAAKIAVGLPTSTVSGATSLYQYLTGNSIATADTVKLIATKDITFVNSGVDEVVFNSATTSATTTANGLDYYELKFQVQDKANAGIPGQEVTFSVNKLGATLSATTATTDLFGFAKVKVYATKADTFTVQASSGGKSATQAVTFAAGGPFDIALKSDNNQKVALAQTNKTFEFEVKDIQGNRITFATDNAAAGAVSASVVTEPTDSSISVTVVKSADDNANLKIASFSKEGNYKVRAKLANGKYADVSFTVKKQGDITGLTLSYDETSLPVSGKSGAPTVKRVDAEGVSLEVASPYDNIDFYTSNSDLATMGSGVTKGHVYATTNSDNAPGTVTITAIDTSNKKTASFSFTINKPAIGIQLVAPAAATEIGTTALVTIKTVDKNGNVVALGSQAGTQAGTYYVLGKPSGAIASAADGTDFSDNLKQKGQATIKVDSNKAGDVTIQVVLGAWTGTTTVKFVEPAPPKVVIGAKAVTMFIGATGYVQDSAAKVTDVAPFIKDGRTFVAVRPLAEAFGAQIGWNAATQTVTLTRSDMTLTIVIGSNAITKVAGGVTTTVTADVPAFIKDGRTVLPFRAVGEAFGATVSYDAATQAVSFAQ